MRVRRVAGAGVVAGVVTPDLSALAADRADLIRRYRETRALHDAAPSTPERRELLFQLTADVGLFNRCCPSLRIEAADCATVAG